MDVPGIVRERLGDERRMTSVNIGGDDRVYVTPPRTLVYHSSGLFSRESVEEYSHEARRFDVSADRREASFAFEYADGVQGFSIPRERIETVLPPVLAGILQTTGLIGVEEAVEESFRFGERTLVVTDSQILMSVGEAVWDRDHESYAYENITDLRFEDDLLIEIDGRPRRIELSGDGRRAAYETVEAALLSYHGVAAVEELPQHTEQRPEQTRTESETTAAEWGAPERNTRRANGRIREIDDAEPANAEPSATASPPSRSSATSESPEPPIREAPESGEPATTETRTEATANSAEAATPERDTSSDTDDRPDLSGELDALRESIERQTELIERQQETLERLVEELGDDQRTEADR